MRIAVSYIEENGDVFDHFGHAEAFKLYDIEENEIKNTEIVYPNGMGHTVMVNFMVENNVDVVICGFIGSHALDGLKEVSIRTYITEPTSADDVVKAYLNGELSEELEGAECGCGGHGHHHEAVSQADIIIQGKNAGKQLSVHYRGTLDDGSVFDSSYDRNEPLTFICGVGQMIRGFDEAVVNMEVGQVTDIHLLPEQAYGEKDPFRVITLEISQLPGSEELVVGQQVYLTNQFGQPILTEVTAKDDTNITFDMNHPMAGKNLNFHIELLSVE